MRYGTVLCATGLLLLGLSTAASAQPFISAGIGTSDRGDARFRTFTGNIGWFGGGWLGFEGDLGSAAKTPYPGTATRTASFSVLVGPRFEFGFGDIRPYGSGGAGVLNAVSSFKQFVNPFDSGTQLEPVATAGGGAILMFSGLPRLGIRIDVREIWDLKKYEVTGAAPRFLRIAGGIQVALKGGK